MPCDQRISISVKLKNCDVEVMGEVLREMGLESRVWCDIEGLFGDQQLLTEERVGRIKQKYAEKKVQKSAKKLGWRVERQKDGKVRVSR